jgi:hypothetical protein
MIVGLVSCYREGRLAQDAVQSLLSCCDAVRVLEGPIGEPADGGRDTDWKAFHRDPRVIVQAGGWETDAAKRTALLQTTRRYPPPVWGVIVDGDELLMYGDGIPALLEHHEQEAEARGEVSWGATLRLVEGDGSCGLIMARLLRLDLIERWLISSYHLLLKNGVEVSRPNAYLLAGAEADRDELEPSTGMQVRRPLQGEPHILHRSFLRPPQRTAERQSKLEGSEFDRLVRDAGLGGVHGERPADDRVGIWLPQ